MNKTLWIRSRTALIFGLVMLGFLLFSLESNFVLLGLVFILCSWEYCEIIGKTAILKKGLTCLTILILVLLPLFIDISSNVFIGIAFVALAFQIFSIYSLYTDRRTNGTHNEFVALLYLGLPGFLSTAVIKEYPIEGKLLFFAFIIIWVSDSAAYLVGSNIGKRKLFPSVSPNKSIEGFVGAGIFAVITAWICGQLTFLESNWIIIGFIVWIMGSYGDLIESAIKRQFGVKDSSNILPGHGGFLDRFDSFIYIWPSLALFNLICPL